MKQVYVFSWMNRETIGDVTSGKLKGTIKLPAGVLNFTFL